MATLVIRFPDGSSQEHALSEEATVGRADGNDLVLTEGGVSRRHARFFLEGAQVMVEDLGSANGTFVDGEKIEGPTPVGARAQVVVGDYEIGVKAAAKRPSGPRAAPPRPARSSGPGAGEATAQQPAVRAARATRQLPSAAKRSPGAPGAPAAPGAALARRPAAGAKSAEPTGPSLRGLTGPWANKLYPIRGTVVVGRVAGVQIQLEDESVSRRHAELERIETGVVVRDLGSANGTTVNGHPVEGDVELQPGDLVQFGMIELSYEAGDAEALSAPTRRGGTRATGARGAVGRGDASGAGGKKKLVLVAGAAIGVLAMAGIVVGAMGGGEEQGGGGGQGPVGQQVAPLDPKEQVEQLLSECRSYSSTELGQQPRWDKALAACEKARALDPINSTVLQLLQKIETERACAKHYEAGKKLINLVREEEALVEFGKIQRECSYYRVVKPMAREAIAAAKKKAAEDCKTYAARGFWDQAEPRCEKYMTFVCQNMSEEELHAPPGYTVDLSGRKCRKNCWQPKDKMYLNLLRAREKKDPNAAPWMCPPTPLFEEELVVVNPYKEVEKIFKEEFKEPLIREAMLLYWEGKGAEAVVKLHKLRAQAAKAALHQQADDLRKDIDGISNLYRVGSGLLTEEEIERASEAFREVLAMDEKLLGPLAKEKPSFYSRAIEQEMSDQAYRIGKDWADRSDMKKACRIWKQGFAFSRKHPDLTRAVGVCSTRGFNALKGAQSCQDLATVLEWAVDGDGLKEKVEPQMKEWSCSNGE